jgi:hypothetical protein
MNHRREAIDVNLLRVLYAVLTERSVTRAAGKLGQSQPAISLTVSQNIFTAKRYLVVLNNTDSGQSR